MILLLSGLLIGCAHDEFLVEITPKGDSFERKLTCWHVGAATTTEEQSETDTTPLSGDKLERLKQIYGDGQSTDGGKKHVFTEIFQAKTPTDVGGSGTYTRYTSSLGNTVIYAERFRGDDDLATELARRSAAADQLVDLMIGWARSEIGETADFAKLRDFMDGDLRQDLKNIVIYYWTGNAVGGLRENGEAELAVRVWHYLRERGYVSAEELPRLVRAISGVEEQPDLVLSMIRRALARKMGVPDEKPAPECLAFLADADRIKTSFEAHVRTTELYKRALAEWQQDKPEDPDARPPDPGDVVGELVLGQLFPIHILASPDRLEVRLACGTKPFETNGKWDAQARRVTWEHVLATGRSLPAFSYAAWSQPDAESQTARFGRVILTGNELGEYAIWYQALSPAEAAAWNAFLARCEPNEKLRERIETFRFPNDPPMDPNNADEQPASVADTPRQLILAGLESDD